MACCSVQMKDRTGAKTPLSHVGSRVENYHTVSCITMLGTSGAGSRKRIFSSGYLELRMVLWGLSSTTVSSTIVLPLSLLLTAVSVEYLISHELDVFT